MPRLKVLLLSLATLSASAFGQNANQARPGTLNYIEGQASIEGRQLSPKSVGNTELQTGQTLEVKGDRQLVLTGEPAKPQRFDKNNSQDDLYNWSSLRSQYLGEANINLASEYAGAPGFYPGWYWAGGPFGYTWLPGDGLFWSPFGYGFYSPYYLYGGGFIYGRYGRGFAPYRGGAYAYRGGRPVASGNVGGAFAAHPSAGFSGGGGFHGGGMGGGSHGGGGHR